VPDAWLRRAQGDLALAKAPLPSGAFYEDLAFHAQQAAEKAVKAVYRAKGLEFRYTHDLGQLLDGLTRRGVLIPENVQDAVEPTDFAWEARYPRPGEPLSEAGHRRAVSIAEKVVEWAVKTVEESSR
jgi:HEPN domain-containing protein